MNVIMLFTFNLAFLVICTIWYKQDKYTYMAMIQDETNEWDLGAIVDIKTVNATYDKVSGNICGAGYE